MPREHADVAAAARLFEADYACCGGQVASLRPLWSRPLCDDFCRPQGRPPCPAPLRVQKRRHTPSRAPHTAPTQKDVTSVQLDWPWIAELAYAGIFTAAD